jgi:glycosyltransferase involved in cell wall biosynthesis
MAAYEKVLVIMPAWNESATIGSVIKELRSEHPTVDILVVDDGSRDDTVEIARASGAIVLQLPYNLGVGGARRLGYRYASDYCYDIAIQMDADGQHDPRCLSQLIGKLDEADLVIGARFAGTGEYRVRGPRQWAMLMLSAVLSRIAGTKLTDTTSGLRCCNRAMIEYYARFFPVEYLGDTVETVIQGARDGFRIRQVPVAMRARQGGVPSASPVKAALYLLRAMLILALAMIRR